MSEFRVANRYAKSLMDLSIDQKNIEDIFKDITVFKNTIDTIPALQNMLKSPLIFPDKKSQVLREIFEKSFQSLTMSFFDIIIRKKREYFLDQIAKAFIEQYYAYNKISTVMVKTAVQVNDKVNNEIKQQLEKATGNKIVISNSVDADLIGGLVIQIEDRLYDASISGKLKQVRKELKNEYISK